MGTRANVERVEHKMNIDERIKEIADDLRGDNEWESGEQSEEQIKQLIREARLDEASQLAKKVFNLLPAGSAIELDIGTTIEGHLFRLRKEAGK